MQTKTNKQHPSAHEIKSLQQILKSNWTARDRKRRGHQKSQTKSDPTRSYWLGLGFPCTTEGGIVAPRLQRAVKFSMSVHVLKNVKKSTSCPQGLLASEWQSQIIAGSKWQCRHDSRSPRPQISHTLSFFKKDQKNKNPFWKGED